MTTTLDTYRPPLLGRNAFDDIFDSMLDLPTLVNRTTQGYPVADIYKGEDGSTVMEFALAGFQKENLHVNILPEKVILLFPIKELFELKLIFLLFKS